jgi:glycosyltransferase involved in cell wall biosynthesis
VRIIVATSFVPFQDGGASLLFDWLCSALQAAGHDVHPLALPFDSRSEEYLEQLVGWRSIDLRGRSDALIALRTPSYLLRHDRKVCWFIHHHRAAYDLWGTRWSSIPDDADGQRLRDAIRAADDVALRECCALFANSPIVSRRLRRYNGLDADVLLPPVGNPERFRCDRYGDTIFYPSRLTGHKRQDLAIDAMRYTATPVRLVIAGEPDDPGYLADLRARAAESPARGRIEVRGGWMSERDKENVFAEALAAVYLPYDEDSYGYPVVEAALASKCTITTADSGGCAEFVRDGVTGRVVEPNPAALGAAFDALYADRGAAERLGAAARETLESAGVRWDRVVERLIGAVESRITGPSTSGLSTVGG